MKHSKEDLIRAKETLALCYPKGSTVYTILESVSRSGMQARIRVLAQWQGGTFSHPNWAVSVLTGYSLKRGYRDSLAVNGCGFDRAHAIKEAIERALGYRAGDLNHVDL